MASRHCESNFKDCFVIGYRVKRHVAHKFTSPSMVNGELKPVSLLGNFDTGL